MAILFKLDDSLNGRLQRLAARQQRSTQEIMREAIRHYVDCEEARESFRREALASWEEYRDTGQHLTGDELREWLRLWGTHEETEIPTCHS
ncbi:CopG family transcriptional regulator [Labrys miyagiensis]|uniref:CopG family transcriptional regulator n=1 Tax=Labrys miyagiensis TaxID=346912 RepID=A0ABQ6CW74_9HYPH|nr:ribbon-helix-helix protein, CopG family [Labrys miyagiensis]GLS22542.1 CopG family transcriptional regulator [Labrys miyagiensis]